MKKLKKNDSLQRPEPREDLEIRRTYQDYFLQYASYVITDRAIPEVSDGLKPVQRRILHSMWENEDGRYNKVANLVGNTMKYHPHGDASIYSAMVGMGQKELLIDTQGNWGDPVTNDSAAAARYIEARLTPFAKDVVFAPHLTRFKLSYDGRNKEPVTFPVRFPLLLATGAEGIAVGLSTRILPHNFIELLEAQKSELRGRPFEIFPDFPSGGYADVSSYQDGAPGSRVKVRAKIEQGQGKSVIIREIPYGTTTESVIDSILSASEKGKIKVARIEDNSASELEIVVTFSRGVDMDKAVDALYAFTDCEVTLSSNCMVIEDGRPVAKTASEMLVHNADQTRRLLREDLQIQQQRLEDRWHQKSLVQIFVENRIYLRIEECKTWDSVLSEIDKGLEPFKAGLRREVTTDDLVRLTEVKIRRISAWDSDKAREELDAIEAELAKVRRFLRNVTQYTIDYLDGLLLKYGAGRQRRTELTTFESVRAVTVVERIEKLFVDAKAGFIGTEMKGEQEVGACSHLDDVLVIRGDGSLVVTRVAEKKYVGEGIVHVQVFSPEDRETVFNLIYTDVQSGRCYAKRFQVGGVTRDKTYPLGKGQKGTRLHDVSIGSGCFVFVKLRKKPRIKTDIYLAFDDLLIKGRSAGGLVVSKHAVSSVRQISQRVYEDRIGAPRVDPSESPKGSTAGDPQPPDEPDDQKKLFE